MKLSVESTGCRGRLIVFGKGGRREVSGIGDTVGKKRISHAFGVVLCLIGWDEQEERGRKSLDDGDYYCL